MNATKSLSLVTALGGVALLFAFTERSGASSLSSGPRLKETTPVQTEGITVVGTGRVGAAADQLVVRTWLNTNAPVASDANDEYLENRRRVLETLAKVELEGLEVRGLGAMLTYTEGQDPGNGMMGAFIINGQTMEANPNVRYREEFLLTVSGVDALDDAGKAEVTALLLDAAVDSGLELHSDATTPNYFMMGVQQPPASASAGLVTFTLTNPAAVERAAYAAALDQATRRAQALAELAGLTLGSVVSIEVLSTTETWRTASANNLCEAQLRVRFGQP